MALQQSQSCGGNPCLQERWDTCSVSPVPAVAVGPAGVCAQPFAAPVGAVWVERGDTTLGERS